VVKSASGGAQNTVMDTVSRLERGEELRERTVDAIRHALEAAGVEFTNGDQPGVRLKRPQSRV